VAKTRVDTRRKLERRRHPDTVPRRLAACESSYTSSTCLTFTRLGTAQSRTAWLPRR
jgi:hypothetical protein